MRFHLSPPEPLQYKHFSHVIYKTNFPRQCATLASGKKECGKRKYSAKERTRIQESSDEIFFFYFILSTLSLLINFTCYINPHKMNKKCKREKKMECQRMRSARDGKEKKFHHLLSFLFLFYKYYLDVDVEMLEQFRF